MKRLQLLVPVAGLAAIAASAQAQEVITLDDIIVSGGFSPIAAAQYGRAATVVTAEDIQQRGITTIQDALRALPGVAVNGAGDSSTQVRIRGGESSHTLILIDGIAAAGGEGEYNLGGLETMNIERIEVLRGPQSVYYGSNASAGVINIVTKKGAEGTTATAGLEVGAGTIATAPTVVLRTMAFKASRGTSRCIVARSAAVQSLTRSQAAARAASS